MNCKKTKTKQQQQQQKKNVASRARYIYYKPVLANGHAQQHHQFNNI